MPGATQRLPYLSKMNTFDNVISSVLENMPLLVVYPLDGVKGT